MPEIIHLDCLTKYCIHICAFGKNAKNGYTTNFSPYKNCVKQSFPLIKKSPYSKKNSSFKNLCCLTNGRKKNDVLVKLNFTTK